MQRTAGGIHIGPGRIHQDLGGHKAGVGIGYLPGDGETIQLAQRLGLACFCIGGVGFGLTNATVKHLPIEREAHKGGVAGGARQAAGQVVGEGSALLGQVVALQLAGEGQVGPHLQPDGPGVTHQGFDLQGTCAQFLALSQGLLNGIPPAERPDRNHARLFGRQGQRAGLKVEEAGEGIHGLDAVLVGVHPGDQQGDGLGFQPADFAGRTLTLIGADVNGDGLIEQVDQILFPLQILLQGGVGRLNGKNQFPCGEGQPIAQRLDP